jgi:hypothetical protein
MISTSRQVGLLLQILPVPKTVPAGQPTNGSVGSVNAGCALMPSASDLVLQTRKVLLAGSTTMTSEKLEKIKAGNAYKDAIAAQA